METNSSAVSGTKIPKIRSVAYPSVSIEAAIDLTKRIDDEFTDVTFTPRETISKNLNVSGGGLDRNLSSCVQYGLLELKSKLGYKPTALFKKIKRPLPDENLKDLLKECLCSPELYKKLLQDFNDKQLPSLTGLSNILDRLYSVKGDAASKAARVFLNNLESLELIAGDNVLKMEGGITPTEEVEQEIEDVETTTPPNTSAWIMPPATSQASIESTPPSKNTIEIPVFLKDGREAKIIMPEDFTDEDIKRVSKVVAGYLPE